MSGVTLKRVDERHAETLANLLELYCYDMSAYFPIEIGADGRFRYPHLARYLAEPTSRFAYLTFLDERLAGFVMATRGSPGSDDPDVLDVAEFFVLRGFRRRKVGERAAERLWDELKGRWIVRVASANRPALAFWERAIADYTKGPAHAKPRTLSGIERQVFELQSR